MNDLVLSLAWCWLQTLVVAGLAIALGHLAGGDRHARARQLSRRACSRRSR